MAQTEGTIQGQRACSRVHTSAEGQPTTNHRLDHTHLGQSISDNSITNSCFSSNQSSVFQHSVDRRKQHVMSQRRLWHSKSLGCVARPCLTVVSSYSLPNEVLVPLLILYQSVKQWAVQASVCMCCLAKSEHRCSLLIPCFTDPLLRIFAISLYSPALKH